MGEKTKKGPSKKPPKTPASPRPSAAPPPGADAAPEAGASEEAFECFLAEARALPVHEVEEFAFDDSIVYQNHVRGVRDVVGLEGPYRNASILAGLPVDPAWLREGPLLAQGFLFARLQINREVFSDGTIQDQLDKGYPLRRLLLDTANLLVRQGLLPDAEVAPIRPGSGKRDAANDLVRLAALFKKHWEALLGKHAIKLEQVNEAARIGSRLQTLLKGEGNKAAKLLPEPTLANIDLCNRFWTLLKKRHELLWKCGAWVFGPSVDEHVPPLLSRQRAPRKPEPEPGPTK